MMWGNSAFTMLACSLIPIWFKTLAVGEGAGRISSDAATGIWALGVSIVTIIVALLGPVCGTLSDRRGAKLIFFPHQRADRCGRLYPQRLYHRLAAVSAYLYHHKGSLFLFPDFL